MSRSSPADKNLSWDKYGSRNHIQTSIKHLRKRTTTGLQAMTTETEGRPASWKILLAFAIIYFVWGSTFLAIRIGVHEVPPFLLAALRFSVAGLALYAWR